MALKKTLDFKGLEINDAYIKIAIIDIRDSIVDEEKVYTANLNVSIYADSNKTDVIDSYGFSIPTTDVADLTYSKLYTALKEQPLLAEATNC